MAFGKHDSIAIFLSIRLYRCMLLLYPIDFQTEYTEEMVQTFRDLLRAPGERLPALWGRILQDLLVSVWKERWDAMNRGRMGLLALATTAGLMIAWIDSRPNWDDTGITAGSLLLTSAVFGAAAPKSPWQWALAIGIWIPILGIVQKGNFGTALALIFAFAGAYGGSALRRAVAPPGAPSGDRP